MNITQIENTITLASTQTSGYEYIHVIQQVTISATTVIHEVFTFNNSSKVLPSDGYYILIEMKMPTTPGDYYYIVDNVIYDPAGDPVTIAEVLLLNPVTYDIDRNDNDLFTIYVINEYYINALKARFQNIICGCTTCDTTSKLTMDTLEMGLALIEYLNVYSQYYESQRIIEQLGSCLSISTSTCNCNA